MIEGGPQDADTVILYFLSCVRRRIRICKERKSSPVLKMSNKGILGKFTGPHLSNGIGTNLFMNRLQEHLHTKKIINKKCGIHENLVSTEKCLYPTRAAEFV